MLIIYRVYETGILDKPVNFLIGKNINGIKFSVSPTKLEKLDLNIDIPGLDFYTEDIKRAKKKIVLPQLGIKSLQLASFIFNYVKNDPDNGDLGYLINNIIKKQNKMK